MKLFKVRVTLHCTNVSHLHKRGGYSVGGYPDLFIIAENELRAREKALNYKEENAVAVRINFVEEVKEPLIL